MDDVFNMIKLKDFKKLKEFILKNTNMDLNIYDQHNNYLIHYLILYDQYDILKLVLKRDIRLDILDIDDRTILHTPIKYNYTKILELLLESNKELIGVSIVDIKDKLGLTALHYCVVLDNFECLEILLKYNADPLLKNASGLNSIHLALLLNRERIFKYLIDKVELTFLSNKNETILQMALSNQNLNLINYLITKNINLDNQEKEYGLTALHLSIIYNYKSITEKLINNSANINIQDDYGNSALMYAVSNLLFDQMNILLKYSYLNYNLTNINGETALHILLKKNEKKELNKFIENTDLNIQDNEGNTCLYLLTKNNEFNKNLQNKILNIFIKNNNNESVYDLIKDDKYKIEIIINSFYKNLQDNKEKLLIDWEIWCSTKENQKLKNITENKCKENIRDIILKEHRSIPLVKDINLFLDNGIFVNTCYYTGEPIDILFGLLFLYETFREKNLNLILDYPLTENKELEKHLESMGSNYNYLLDFCNFEIKWSFQKLILPTYFKYEIIKKIKNSEYIVIPIGIQTTNGSHANILFYDVKTSSIERFEPNGKNYPKGFNYNPVLLDKLIEDLFIEFDSKIKYYKPNDYLPLIGFQILENINGTHCKRIGDPNGFCGVWCIWWIYHKMKNLKIDSKELAEKLIKEVKFKNISFKTLIRNFSKKISDIRDEYLKKNNMDINDFIVGNYEKGDLDNLEKAILKNFN
jgi:ankyrin repeat protein